MDNIKLKKNYSNKISSFRKRSGRLAIRAAMVPVSASLGSGVREDTLFHYHHCRTFWLLKQCLYLLISNSYKRQREARLQRHQCAGLRKLCTLRPKDDRTSLDSEFPDASDMWQQRRKKRRWVLVGVATWQAFKAHTWTRNCFLFRNPSWAQSGRRPSVRDVGPGSGNQISWNRRKNN